MLTGRRGLVYAAVAGSPTPLTAYEILDKLRRHGVTAPPTVYRALSYLLERRMIHRIESLNAYVACGSVEQPHEGYFIICRNCGSVSEILDERLERTIAELADERGFTIDHKTIEASGQCRDCRAKLSGRASA
jgi:Fur family zinc uptake transcriptional regulator